MACAGVVASAGAQLDLFFITKGSFQYTISVGKGTSTIQEAGYASSGRAATYGSVSYAIGSGVRVKGGTEHVLNYLTDSGISGHLAQLDNPKVGGSTGDNAPVDSYTCIAVHNPTSGRKRLLRSQTSAGSSGDTVTTYTWIGGGNGYTYDNTLFKNVSNGTVIPCELRADL